MADAKHVEGEDTDEDTPVDESMPELVDTDYEFSDTEDECEHAAAKTCTKSGSDVTEEENAVSATATAAASTSFSKRGAEHLQHSQNIRKRSKMNRNTCHEAKLECLDVQEIRTFLKTKVCGCEKQCLRKLNAYKERAVQAIEKLRLQRFKGKLCSPCKTCTTKFSHPGVENIS